MKNKRKEKSKVVLTRIKAAYCKTEGKYREYYKQQEELNENKRSKKTAGKISGQVYFCGRERTGKICGTERIHAAVTGKYCIFRRTKPDLCAAGCIFGAVGYNKKDTKYAVHPTGRTSG